MAAPTVPPMSDFNTRASIWFSIPGASCQVGWNDGDDNDDDWGGGDNGSGGATSLVSGGFSGASEAMVGSGQLGSLVVLCSFFYAILRDWFIFRRDFLTIFIRKSCPKRQG